MQSRLLLAKLPPLKSIMCVVRNNKGMLGTAMSDPYLGFASPLASVPTIAEVEQLIQEHKPGGLAFGLPMAAMTTTTTTTHPPDDCHGERKNVLLSSHHDWNGVSLICTIDEQLSLEEALRRKETEWEMWEEIDDPGDGEASTEAAVALNAWLWEHCGGWRNTFG
jgi:RNase H-fold protein (predicted Holliday junction resolvase)